MPSEEQIRYQIKRPYIVWLGPVFDEDTTAINRAVSPAASRWQLGIIAALQRLGLAVAVIGYIPEPAWPKGRFHLAADDGNLAPGIVGEVVSYHNVPGYRAKSILRGYKESLVRWCDNAGKPVAVVSYNAPGAYSHLGEYAQERYGIPWICVLADGPVPAAHPDGFVILAWESYVGCQHPHKLHLDGGITRLRFGPNATPISRIREGYGVLFAGAVNRSKGVAFLAEGFHLLKRKDVELWICGKGANAKLERIARLDKRIKRFGFVPDDRLTELSRRAALFVNPRLSSIGVNELNFPSKVLEYLSYGKPVISTWTKGLSPEYRPVLIVLEEETPECLARTIEDVLGWNETQLGELAMRIKTFLKGRTWDAQASGLIRWLSEIQVL